MKNYLRWSFRQLYLFFFWPTRFRREVEGDAPSRRIKRLMKTMSYLLRMLPWIILLIVTVNLIAGYTCELLGIPFDRGFALAGLVFSTVLGVALIMAFGIVLSAVLNVATNVAFCLALSIVLSVVTSVASGTEFGAAPNVVLGMAQGDVRAEMAGSIILGKTFGWGLMTSFLIAFSVALGVARGEVPAVGMISSIATYPLDVALAAAAYFTVRLRPRAVVRAWRWCPVAWSELIWLPLPFVSELLVLVARQDRKEGLRQITFVAAERRQQSRAALKALAEIITDDLWAKSVLGMADVTDRLEWTTELPPVEYSFGLMNALTRFDRVARYAGQYLTLQNDYRKKDTIDRALAELEVLQHSFIVAQDSSTPRLLQTANEWHKLLEAEREKLRALTEAAHEIPNPFVCGNPVVETEHNVFTGRQDIVRQIEANMLGAAQTPTLLLHGPRRVGKTSILNQLPRLLGPDFASAVVDCQNPAVMGSEGTLLRYISRACGEGLRRRHVRVEPLTAAKLEREPFAVFDEWLDAVERAMPEGMRALLCLDEYERLQATLDAGWGGAFLDALRHTLQHRPRVVLMFTGAHTFQELGPEWTDRFISARRVRVSFLEREDVEFLLTKPIPEFDMKYAPGALDAVVAATSCQPFLTQAVAFELVQHLNEQQRKEATPADVEEAIRRALVSGGEYFANVWSDTGAEGQAILRALAAGETPPDFAAARAWLREHDVLDGEGSFAVEMMRRWVRARLESPVRGDQPF
jgi:uncharacterized protein